MKLAQTVIEKNFTVVRRGKTYYVNYIDSDGHTLSLCNRYTWQVTCEDGEELDIYEFSSMKKKEKMKISENARLFDELVSFCAKHFNDYEPDI